MIPTVGQRVRLLPFEDLPEEYGTVISVDRDTCIVELDEHEPSDDGIREVPFDQVTEP